MKKGLFISLEGIEATGKSTIAEMLKDELKGKVLTTREPGGIKISEDIREIIMLNELDGKTELLLFLAARRSHLKEKILPALAKYDYVICDRYSHSTFAYQGYGRGENLNNVFALNNYATDNVFPDIVFLIDIPVDVSIKRKSGVEEQNRLDHLSKEFYTRVREGYLEMAKQNKYGHIHVIDGEQTIEDMVKEITEYINLYEFAQTIYGSKEVQDGIKEEKYKDNIVEFKPKEENEEQE